LRAAGGTAAPAPDGRSTAAALGLVRWGGFFLTA
jgi:hypothetical protein